MVPGWWSHSPWNAGGTWQPCLPSSMAFHPGTQRVALSSLWGQLEARGETRGKVWWREPLQLSAAAQRCFQWKVFARDPQVHKSFGRILWWCISLYCCCSQIHVFVANTTLLASATQSLKVTALKKFLHQGGFFLGVKKYFRPKPQCWLKDTWCPGASFWVCSGHTLSFGCMNYLL